MEMEKEADKHAQRHRQETGDNRHRDTNIQEANRQGAIKKKKVQISESVHQSKSIKRQTDKQKD